jgi:hypothetical protein
MPDDSTYISMFLRLFDDLSACVPDYTPRERDLDREYALRRIANEGISFLTRTLPSLGKALDASFQDGTFVPHPSFQKEKGRATPKFLRVLFKAVFDSEGVILTNPSPDAVGHIRQACFMFYKLEEDYAPEVVEDTVNGFLDVDAELAHVDLSVSELRPVIIEAKKVIENVMRGLDPRDITPRPGPGASASGTHKSLRYEMLTKWDQVHQVYPVYEYFFVNRKHLSDRVPAYWKAIRKDAPTSKMRLVPKDSRGPRIICMEEQEVMFLQQGLADAMRKRIESHGITKGKVNFTSQEVNRQLAKHASCTSGLSHSKATLDMKEASDRISRELVATLFSGLPLLTRALLSLSTRQIELPNGDVRDTLKFAPMGSSLCFPVMSLVHFALGRAVIKLYGDRRHTALADSIYVYGDDIIVDSSHAQVLFDWFPRFGLKFNVGKSFTKGPFRESCGFDAFLGKNVSPQRVKKRFFCSADPQHLVAGLDLEGHLYSRGYLHVAEYIRTVLLHRNGGIDLPYVPYGAGVLGWRRPPSEIELSILKSRRSRNLQCREYRARVIITEPDVSMSGGWERLMRALVTGNIRRSDVLAGPYHTQSIGWRWVPESSFLPQSAVIRALLPAVR